MSHKNKSGKVLWDGTYGFSSLSEKTRKYNHLQMSLRRQHFLGPTTVWTCDLLLADWCSPNWANQVAVINVPDELRRQSYSVGPSSSFICICQYLEAKWRQKKTEPHARRLTRHLSKVAGIYDILLCQLVNFTVVNAHTVCSVMFLSKYHCTALRMLRLLNLACSLKHFQLLIDNFLLIGWYSMRMLFHWLAITGVDFMF